MEFYTERETDYGDVQAVIAWMNELSVLPVFADVNSAEDAIEACNNFFKTKFKTVPELTVAFPYLAKFGPPTMNGTMSLIYNLINKVVDSSEPFLEDYITIVSESGYEILDVAWGGPGTIYIGLLPSNGGKWTISINIGNFFSVTKEITLVSGPPSYESINR